MRWGKVNILTNRNKNAISNIARDVEYPYNDINIVKAAKILGHMCTTNTDINTAIDDRLDTGKADWCEMRRSFITDEQIANKLQIKFFETLTRAVVTYGIALFGRDSANIKLPQNFCSICIRDINRRRDRYKHEL